MSDVARAVADACLKDVADRAIINLGSGIETSINQLAGMLLELTGAKSELRHAPPRAGDIRHSVARIDRAKSALGYEPTVPLRDGLRETLDWMRGSMPRLGPVAVDGEKALSACWAIVRIGSNGRSCDTSPRRLRQLTRSAPPATLCRSLPDVRPRVVPSSVLS